MFSTSKSAIIQTTAYQILRNHVGKILSEYGLTTPEWTILGHVINRNGTSIDTLVKILHSEAVETISLIKVLKKKELLVDQEELADQRICYKLTDRGKNLLPQIESELQKEMFKLLKGIPQADIYAYMHVLEMIIENEKKAI